MIRTGDLLRGLRNICMRRCKLFCRWVLITQMAILIFAALPIKAAHASEMVFISEVAWAGSSRSTADEWIELANPSDMEADISGWVLQGAGASGSDIIFPQDTTIPPNGALLAANYDAGHSNAAHSVAPQLVTSDISLSNSKMLIQLFDADGALIDQAGDGGAPFGGYSGDIKASMVRVDAELLGDGEAVWNTCEQAENMLTDDCGTPGMVEILNLAQDNVADLSSDEPEFLVAETAETETSSSTDRGEIVTSDETDTPATNTEAVNHATSTQLETGATSTEMMPSAVELAPEVTTTSAVISTEIEAEDETVINVPTAPTSTVMSEPESQLPRSSFQQETIIRFLRMNEVMAAPEKGKEWVELINLAADRTIVLDGLEIHDSTSRAIKLSGEIKPQEKFKVFEISSSKLNNSGDSVYLQTADGIVIDSLTYAGHDRGTLLARDEKQKWQYTNFPTPGADNIILIKAEEEIVSETNDTKEPSKEQTTIAPATSVKLSHETDITVSEADKAEKQTQEVEDFGPQMLLRLNEVMPNPEEGKEWVEIISYATTVVSLEGLELHDAAGKILSLKGSIQAQEVLALELASARLNNSGDTVSLVNHEGQTIDKLSYSGSQKGLSYARQADGSWHEADPTKGEMNFQAKEQPELTKSIADAAEITASRVSSVSSQKQTTAKKASTSSSAKNDQLISINDFSMLHQEQFGGMRVKLRGTVGTTPGQVSGRAFILLNHEGRGLLVKVPSYKKIPAFGSFLTITGNLKFDSHELPYLSLTKKDDWIAEKQLSIAPKPRIVNFLAPQAESAWSLVMAEGVVNDVSGATVHMIVNDIDVNFKIKSGVAYRASRIKKGDVVKVSGVLDITDDIASIIPRSADEIELISHAKENLAATSKQDSGMPGWTPFGAAAIAVGAVEGLKQVKKRIKKETMRSVFNKALAR